MYEKKNTLKCRFNKILLHRKKLVLNQKQIFSYINMQVFFVCKSNTCVLIQI